MRHLNKIIFLNSANIPYAEVMLDGNVHFSGTQGVGKSTLLRALLFFYNADKKRLGIQAGQKSFEEFYLPNSNSYIAYEVRGQHGFYTILVSRSRGSAVFRFIDAPFCRDWLIDDAGRVESDWIRIRDRIGTSTDISDKIDTYSFYRDIIFGNTHDRSHRYDKYALVESGRYQNIPRSIQNVFLNSKLDADFVKNTIIQSMAESEDIIRLADYRHLVAEFEREFDEIDCWFRKDARGEVIVRVKAAKVIETYRLLVALEHDICRTWHRLNYTVADTNERLPQVEDTISGLEDALKKIQEKLDALVQEYGREHDAVTKNIGRIDNRLDDIRAKRKYYTEIGIGKMLELSAGEPMLQEEKMRHEGILHSLRKEYEDITEKYRVIYAELDAELKSFTHLQAEELLRLNNENQKERENGLKNADERKRVAEEDFRRWEAELAERMVVFNREYNLADKKFSELKYWRPMQQQICSVNEDINNLGLAEKECARNLELIETEQNTIRRESQAECDGLEAKHAMEMQDKSAGLKRLEEEMAEIAHTLQQWNGSLYEWLSENKPGWEGNIGKVADEREVLLAHGLEPELSTDTGFYGVKLNLDAIPDRYRTQDEYRKEHSRLSAEIEVRRREIDELKSRQAKEIETVRKRCHSLLAEKKQEQMTLEYEAAQLPVRRKDAETTLRRLQDKEAEMVGLEREKREAALNEAKRNLDREEEARRQQRERRDKIIRGIDNGYKSLCRQLNKRIEESKSHQSEQRTRKENDIEKRRMDISRREHDELEGRGADTAAISQCQKRLDGIVATLREIDSQRIHVIGYRKDTEELFSHEDEYRQQKRNLEEKDAQLRQRYEKRRKVLETDKADTSQQLREVNDTIKEMKAGLDQYEKLCHVEDTIPEALMQDDTKEKNNVSCQDLIVAMRSVINRKQRCVEDLKRSVNSFNTHFGAGNTFNFIVPQCDDDYRTFAVNLQDFIDNDKIEEYRKRVSDHYNTILRSISREVGMLINHSAEIIKIINEINRDFRERNFAGVIRGIELRAEDTSDHLMQLMRNIHDFTIENSSSIGEANLFSGDDRDKVNARVVEYLRRFTRQLQKEPSRTEMTLSDTFRLQFRIQENDNDTGWVERISNVGSDGTDILVKAMVNIMLINVFKTKAARKNGDFIVHCMMDEIGKLHPGNVAGILRFANVRNIYLINSSPVGYNADIYKYNYLLTKDGRSKTHVRRLITVNL